MKQLLYIPGQLILVLEIVSRQVLPMQLQLQFSILLQMEMAMEEDKLLSSLGVISGMDVQLVKGWEAQLLSKLLDHF
jgi:hypothetical protein